MKKLTALFLLLCLIVVDRSNAQGDFFWSEGGLNSGLVVNQDLELTVGLGETVSTYLFWDTRGPSMSQLRVGGGLDITTSESGIIAFESAETFEFDVVLSDDMSVVVGERWESSSGLGFAGPAGIVTPDEVVSLAAFTALAGPGINDENDGNGIFFDTGYDVLGDAFLFGRLDFTGLEIGTVNVDLSVGSINVTDDGINPLVPIFGNLTVNVVPEPVTALVLVPLTVCSMLRRRKP